MNVHRAAGCLVMQAPAKVNLFFEILARRSDGFHEIETLMCPIRIFDTLSLQNDPSGEIVFSGHWCAGLRGSDANTAPQSSEFGDLPQGSDNLVVRALELLREKAGHRYGARVRLVKRIPSQAGLGGGSSDAAAALILANQAWGLGWSRERLMELAGALGSDVPFFLLNCAAICRGRGELLEPVHGLGQLHLVVVRPPEGLSTAAVYRACLVPARPKSCGALVSALQESDVRPVSALMHNALQEPAEGLSPWIDRLKREFASTGCLAHQMSGSGSSYFGVYRNARQARRVTALLRARNLGRVYSAASVNG